MRSSLRAAVQRVLPFSSTSGSTSTSSSWMSSACFSSSRLRRGLEPDIYKYSSRNFLSAFIMALVVLLLIASFCTDWVAMFGGACNEDGLSVSHFFYSADIVDAEAGHTDFVFYTMDGKQVLRDCVTHDMYATMKTILVLVFIAIASCLVQVLLDVIAPPQPCLKLMQCNAVCSFLTTLFCMTICALTFWVAHLLYRAQHFRKRKPGLPVFVVFSTGFYLITAAGALSLVAAATNCFHYPLYVCLVLRDRRNRMGASASAPATSASGASHRHRRHRHSTTSRRVAVLNAGFTTDEPPAESPAVASADVSVISTPQLVVNPVDEPLHGFEDDDVPLLRHHQPMATAQDASLLLLDPSTPPPPYSTTVSA